MVGAIVAVACAWIATHSVAITEWVVMTDELQHVKLAISVFSEPTLNPTIRGESVGAYSHLYPLLISPLWALFAVPEAWRLTHLANALFFASAAIPVYLLTRQIVASRVAAYATAVAAVAVPWVGLSMMVMTEAAAYPAFLWAVLAIHVAIARPSTTHDLLALGGILLAFFGRTQLVILAGILPLALLLHEFGFALVRPGAVTRWRALRDAPVRLLRDHKLIVAVYALAGSVALVLGPREVLDEVIGNYGGTTTAGDLLPPGFWDSAPRQLEVVVVGAAALPFVFAAGWALGSLVKPRGRSTHAFAVLGLLTIPLLTWEATTFGLNHVGTTALIDRYLFYVVPLIFVGAAAFLMEGRRPLALVTGIAAFLWLVTAGDHVFMQARGPYMASPASAFHGALDGQTWALGNRFGFNDLTVGQALIVLVPIAAVAVAALSWLRSIKLGASVAAVTMLAFLITETEYVMDRMQMDQNAGHGAIGVPLDERDWVDDAVREGGTAAIVPHYGHDNWTAMRTWWSVETFNKTVRDSYVVRGGADWAPFRDRDMSVADSGEISLEPTVDDPADYLVMPVEELVPFKPAGRVVASFKSAIPEDRGFELLEVDKPYTAAWLTDGFLADGWLEEQAVGRIRVFPAAARDEVPRRVRVTMKFEMPAIPERASSFTIHADGRRQTGGLGAHGVTDYRANVCVRPEGPSEVVIRPRRGIELPDGRVVVLRLTEVDTEPLPGACR